jgi:hypothetical protein
MDLRSRCNQCVLKQIIDSMMGETCPASKNSSIRRQNIVGRANGVDPCLDFVCFGWVPFSGEFDTDLKLTQGHRRDMQFLISNALDPSEHSAMRLGAPQFRNHIRVEQIHRPISRTRSVHAARACAWMADRGRTEDRRRGAVPSGWVGRAVSFSATHGLVPAQQPRHPAW